MLEEASLAPSWPFCYIARWSILILASASPRRQALIRLLGYPTVVHVPDVDEESIVDPDPARNVVETARLKAEAIAANRDGRRQSSSPPIRRWLWARRCSANRLIPTPPVDAQRLRGRTHQVHTGIVVLIARPAHGDSRLQHGCDHARLQRCRDSRPMCEAAMPSTRLAPTPSRTAPSARSLPSPVASPASWGCRFAASARRSRPSTFRRISRCPIMTPLAAVSAWRLSTVSSENVRCRAIRCGGVTVQAWSGQLPDTVTR
jgi:hypothetical protein